MARIQFVEIEFDQILSVGLIRTVIFGASAFVLLPVGSRWRGCSQLGGPVEKMSFFQMD
jgi:hypothetical protein